MARGDKGKLYIRFVSLFTLPIQQDCVLSVTNPELFSTGFFLPLKLLYLDMEIWTTQPRSAQILLHLFLRGIVCCSYHR